MVSIFRSLLLKASNAGDPEQEAILTAAIELAVDGTDSRLRVVSGYKKKLREAVHKALAYADEIVETMQDPVEISKEAYSAVPLTCALFATADALHDFLEHDRTLMDFLKRPENRRLPACYALLRMEREERSMFGNELVGEIVKRDVLQTAVNFTGHRIIAPSATEKGLRDELKQRTFNQIVKCALARLASLRAEREELAEERTLLRIKLDAIHCKGCGLEPLVRAGLTDNEAFNAAQKQLREVEEELGKARAQIETLDDYLAQVREVLSEPEKCLGLTQVSMRLNRMGIKVDEQAAGPSDEIRFHEVRIGDALPVATVIAKIPQSEWQ